MIDSSTGQQMLKLPPSTLAAIHRAALQGRSPAEAAALVRQIGFETGEGFLEAFSHWLEHHRQEAGADPASLGAEEFWHHLSGFFARLGWGRLEFAQMHSGVGSISSREWAEADARRRALHGSSSSSKAMAMSGALHPRCARRVPTHRAQLPARRPTWTGALIVVGRNRIAADAAPRCASPDRTCVAWRRAANLTAIGLTRRGGVARPAWRRKKQRSARPPRTSTTTNWIGPGWWQTDVRHFA